MDLDLVNKEYYNEYDHLFDRIPFEGVLKELILKFLPESHSQILEIGSAAGALALWLTHLGHSITCVEPAEVPAKKAAERGLKVVVSRLQDFYTDHTFDGILAISSLIHVPKADIPAQIEKLSTLVKKEGFVIATFIEGEGEGYEDFQNHGKKRFFSKFSQEEIEAILSRHFSIIEKQRIPSRRLNQTFLLFVGKR